VIEKHNQEIEELKLQVKALIEKPNSYEQDI